MTLAVARSAFVEGYTIGVRHPDPRDCAALLRAMSGLDPARRPFAFEGLGMALRLRERRQPAGSFAVDLINACALRWRLFLRLGIGCALARIGAPPPDDPDALDGFGFQTGLTLGAAAATPRDGPDRLLMGLGRAAWFHTDGDAVACAARISRGLRQDALWRGVGMAVTFAGDPHGQAATLVSLAGASLSSLREGSARAIRLWTGLEIGVPDRVPETARALGLRE